MPKKKMYDTWAEVTIPIVVAVEATSADKAREKTEDMFMKGELNDKIMTAYKERANIDVYEVELLNEPEKIEIKVIKEN